MKRREIKCIKKRDRDSTVERITHVGGEYNDGRNWRETTSDAIKQIEEYGWGFFVTDGFKEVKVVVAVSYAGNKYLKTEADSYEPNNLLSLPECF